VTTGEPMAQIQLDTPVQYVKGVGPTRAGQLEQLGISTVEDLLLYFPFRFDLRKQAQPMATLTGGGEPATVVGEVMAVGGRDFGPKPFFQVELADETGWLFVRWFHGGYLSGKINVGKMLVL
jgi:ATP-dependent DNA helicase RecG